MERKIIIPAILALALAFTCVGFAEAAQSQSNVTVTATVSASATLTLSTGTITFPNTTPPTAMQANENGATITASFRTASTGTLTVGTDQDLTGVNPTNVIPITSMTSTAATSGGGFYTTTPVTWAKTASGGVQLGSGPSGAYQTTMNWALANSWAYQVDTYTAHATFTLQAP